MWVYKDKWCVNMILSNRLTNFNNHRYVYLNAHECLAKPCAIIKDAYGVIKHNPAW